MKNLSLEESPAKMISYIEFAYQHSHMTMHSIPYIACITTSLPIEMS